jgi:hypothetical protein
MLLESKARQSCQAAVHLRNSSHCNTVSLYCTQAVLLEGKAWQSRADELAAQLASQQEAQEAAAAAAGGGCVLRGPEADAAAERDIGDLEALIGGFCYMLMLHAGVCCAGLRQMLLLSAALAIWKRS